MTYSETLNYKYRKPKVGNDWSNWGANLNYNFDTIDSTVHGLSKRTVDFYYPTFSSLRFGEYELLNLAPLTLSASLTAVNVGAHRVVVEILSGGPAILKINGTKLNQNTLVETIEEELIDFDSPALIISRYTWIREIELTCDAGCSCNVYAYSGFSLDKPIKVTKIVFRGLCSTSDNEINLDVQSFNINHNEFSLDPVISLSVDESYGSGNKFIWHKELSINKCLEKGKHELIVRGDSVVPGSWNNVLITINLE